MPVSAPAGGFLSFARPKERNQRKCRPDAACFLRSSLSAEVAERGSLPLRQRDASMHRPSRANPAESSGTRRGKRASMKQNGIKGDLALNSLDSVALHRGYSL